MSAQQSSGLGSFRTFLAKHHPILFIVIVFLLLSGAIFSLYQIIEQTFSQPEPNTSSVTDFDQKTIDDLEKLHDSTDTANELDFPSPRANPFTE